MAFSTTRARGLRTAKFVPTALAVERIRGIVRLSLGYAVPSTGAGGITKVGLSCISINA